MEIILENTLWQSLKKEHLDTENVLSEEEWVDFVDKYGNAFAGLCSEIGLELYYKYTDSKGR